MAVGAQPAATRKERATGFTPLERFLIFIAPLLAAMLTVGYRWQRSADERLADAHNREAFLWTELARHKAEIRALEQKVATLDKSHGAGGAGALRDQLAAATPTGVSIEAYTEEAGAVTLTGTARSYQALSDFVHELGTSNFGYVTIKRAQQKSAFGRIEWELSCRLRDPFASFAQPDTAKHGPIDVPDKYKGPPPRYDLRDQLHAPESTR
jgi:Tfp pilus assembly protein PilN